ncbi:hypothetical protein MHK_002753 [Candidatus Magnetomorum sp. HK-1]|nr:hypothetical protein MHK_002753 [Candidatus Magnetomorum sp. HK-1]
MKLKEISINTNELSKHSINLLYDLHLYIDYVEDRGIKRTYRENLLPKTDSNRLKKWLKSNCSSDHKYFSQDGWLNYVEKIAYNMGFVSYETEGIYVGYTSYVTSFPDNYMEVNKENYEKFLNKTPLQQEQSLLSELLKKSDSCESEFFKRSILGRLKSFDSYGCRSGVAEKLNYAKARMAILDVLKTCKSNIWYSTSSLIDYFKKSNPFFLIPEKIKNNKNEKTYGNFSEYNRNSSSFREDIEIKETDKNAFERVEGRYIERFLEGIPLIMNYIDLAYDKSQEKPDIMPEMNYLKAFKVNDYFLRIANKKIQPPEVWIQPNFEIQVISEIYPGGLLAKLSAFADIIKEDNTVTHLKLKRKKVLYEKHENEQLDVVSFLQKISGRDLAQNVITEINGWCSQTEIFTLYKHIGLLETKQKKLQSLHDCKLEQISPFIQMIHSPDDVFENLEKKETVPILIKHIDSKLKFLDGNLFSAFSENKKKSKAKKQEKKEIVITQKTTITLFFSLKTVFDEFKNKLIKERCPVESNSDDLSLTIPGSHEPLVKDAMKALKKKYKITLKGD